MIHTKLKDEIPVKKEVKLNMVPLHDNIVVKLKELQTKTESGLFLAIDEKTAKIQQGYVLAIPEGLETKLKIGDEVLFGLHCGTAIEIDSQKTLWLTHDEIIGILG